MTTILTGLAMVLIIEGLVLALAPSYFEKMVAMLSEVAPDQRRVIGLVAVSVGVCTLWLLIG